MSGISSHVLDTATGRPATGVPVHLEAWTPAGWAPAGETVTDADGRAAWPAAPQAGVHRLVFDTGAWAAAHGQACFYPRVTVEFEVREPQQHHHVPLLLSPFGYTTYRGT
jgi:5-hydroxyisourate hydrolase